jgi:hypothetical protein
MSELPMKDAPGTQLEDEALTPMASVLQLLWIPTRSASVNSSSVAA